MRKLNGRHTLVGTSKTKASRKKKGYSSFLLGMDAAISCFRVLFRRPALFVRMLYSGFVLSSGMKRFNKKKYESALRTFQRVTRLFPEGACVLQLVYERMAVCYRHLDQHEESRAMLRKSKTAENKCQANRIRAAAMKAKQ